MAKVIIAGNVHLSIPNLPRQSRHTLIRPKPFPLGRYPLEKIWPPFASLAAWQPVLRGYEVVHSFNCIPYTSKPWFVTFEQHLSLYKPDNNKFKNLLIRTLKERLALDNCRKIIAISDYAKLRFKRQLQDWDKLDIVLKKLEIIHPNFPIKVSQPKIYKGEGNLQLLFVGNHIARKGGIVALRLAKKAEEMGLPVTIHIISELRCGSGVPTDFPDSSRYGADLKLLNLSNVVFHKQVPNAKVLELLTQSHFQFLATLHDTYGYSVIEGFSCATPAITTNICALPEFVHHGQNGYLLNLDITDRREWSQWVEPSRRGSDEYWDILDNTYDNLANQALQRLIEFLDRQDKKECYEQLSAGALGQAQNVHDSEKLNNLFNNLYAEAAGEG